MSLSSERMAEAEGLGRGILWAPYIPMPESILRRLPELKEWDKQNQLRDESNQQKIQEELFKLQKAIG